MRRIFCLLAALCALGGHAFSQSVTPVLLPTTMEGTNGTNSNRLPYVFRARLTGLRAGAVYRYINLAVTSADAATTNGAGNCLFAPGEGDFQRTTNPGLGTPGAFGEFSSDASGEYEGWFVLEPTGNARFTPGGHVFIRVAINDGQGGSSVASRLTITDSVRVVKLDTTAAGGTGIRGVIPAEPGNMIFLFTEADGTGRPVAGTFVESDGTDNSVSNGYAAFYGTKVNANAGAFGTVIPNLLPQGIRRIENRSRKAGAIIGTETNTGGVWAGGVSTVDPRGGTSEIVLGDLVLPIRLAWFSARELPGVGVLLEWLTASEDRNYGFSVQRKAVSESAWVEIPESFVPGHGTTTVPQQYEYTDRAASAGSWYYRLRQMDLGGGSRYSEPVAVSVLTGVRETVTADSVTLECHRVRGTSGVEFGFRIAEFGFVKISVYDLLGREVAVVVSEPRSAGKYTSSYDGVGLANGVYICRLQTAQTLRSLKFCLVR